MDAETVKQIFMSRVKYDRKLRIFNWLALAGGPVTARDVYHMDLNCEPSLTRHQVEALLRLWSTTSYVLKDTVVTDAPAGVNSHPVNTYEVNGWVCFWARIFKDDVKTDVVKCSECGEEWMIDRSE